MYSSISEIETPIIDLTERFDKLNVKYFENAINNDNELIRELWSDYLFYTTSKAVNHPTILCKYKNSIDFMLI